MSPPVRRRVDALGAVVGVAVIAACALAVRGGTVGPVEREVFRAINGLPDLLRPPMWAMQLFGVLGTPLVVALVAALLRRWRLAAALVVVAPAKLFFEREVVKQLVERQRPSATVPDAILRGVPTAGGSFPSGHAIIAVAVAWLVLPYLPRRWQVVVVALAVLVGVARVYLGAHNPLDVVGGAGLGLAIGSVLNLVVGVPAADRSPAAGSGGR